MKDLFLPLIIGFSLISFDFASFAFEYDHEVLNVIRSRSGYQKLRLKLSASQKSVELWLPFCNKQSVRVLDQYCSTENGMVSIVTAIKGEMVYIRAADLNSDENFSEFAARVKPLRESSRQPSSVPEFKPAVLVVCEASCPQLDFSTPCQASGDTKQGAYAELKNMLVSHAEKECKLCNLKAVVCDGKLFLNKNYLGQLR